MAVVNAAGCSFKLIVVFRASSVITVRVMGKLKHTLLSSGLVLPSTRVAWSGLVNIFRLGKILLY